MQAPLHQAPAPSLLSAKIEHMESMPAQENVPPNPVTAPSTVTGAQQQVRQSATMPNLQAVRLGASGLPSLSKPAKKARVLAAPKPSDWVRKQFRPLNPNEVSLLPARNTGKPTDYHKCMHCLNGVVSFPGNISRWQAHLLNPKVCGFLASDAAAQCKEEEVQRLVPVADSELLLHFNCTRLKCCVHRVLLGYNQPKKPCASALQGNTVHQC